MFENIIEQLKTNKKTLLIIIAVIVIVAFILLARKGSGTAAPQGSA
jgi:ABC-type lipoprotein release transport system permease subunit